MVVILREQKGTPLTSIEVDGNFKELMTRIELLENNRPPIESLANIQQDGDDLVMTGTLGTVFERIRLPVLHWVMRGKWQNHTDYHVNEVVTYDHQNYVCLKAHNS